MLAMLIIQKNVDVAVIVKECILVGKRRLKGMGIRMGLFKKSQKELSTCQCGEEDTALPKESCCEGSTCECNSDDTKQLVNESSIEGNPVIKILGTGCKNCITLTENTKAALEEMKLEAQIIKVTDMAEIVAYGVMSTPAMVVNEKVVSMGKVLITTEVIKVLTKVLGR